MSDTIPYHERLRLIKLGQLPKEAVAKSKKPIPKQSPRKKAELAERKEAGGDSVLDVFFLEMRKRLRGKCLFCNSGTTWKNEELWRCSIAHLFPKSKFKSIATREENWVELCWDCHTDFDNGKISWEMIFDSHEIKIIRPKLEILLPLCTQEEKKNKLYGKLENLLK